MFQETSCRERMKIAVVGGRKHFNEFDRLFRSDVEVAFFLDNDLQVLGKRMNGINTYSPYDFPEKEIEYIIIFANRYAVVKQELIDLGVKDDSIIEFNSPKFDVSDYQNIFVPEVAENLRLKYKIEDLERKIVELEEREKNFEQNYRYEVLDILKKESYELPGIYSIQETCDKIVKDKCSVSRYGDGEFEIILGHAKDIYQSNDKRLAERLSAILVSDLENHIVALADDYGEMEGMRKENKNAIRRYMTTEKRIEHHRLLNMNKKYYNAYISRPYIIYPHDKVEQARERFVSLQRIWDKKDILFIEGDKTRMGVGNDLFDNSHSVERIIAPNHNAFDVYDEIFEAALQYGKGKLILIALGPTATVLAYDLAKEGYWAVDIGHLDLEYEWFLKGKGCSYVPYKYNNEMLGDTIVKSIHDETYKRSVIKTIIRMD